MTILPSAAEVVRNTAHSAGLPIHIVEVPGTARTAEEAAESVGTTVGQIVKSLVFRGKDSGKPYLLLVSGDNRVHEKGVARDLGESLERPDADYVRSVTGFAIGGIPPFGHTEAMEIYMDEDLVTKGEIWAAAGTPRCVFQTSAEDLLRVTGAKVIKVTK
ncbi:YbaK/EbsC family protein [Breoghania sp.]|uniref:YbaK/EbsC family protein n=1 Tax=Breoghania sp. TaxID=2065378 RepID=UPI002AAA6E2E|nr:YbaK/EbsC family protein [Breoghania sp.]